MKGKIVCMLAALAAAPVLAESGVIYASNYDVVLNADAESGQIRSRSRVRDGHTIPVEFARHKVDIRVSDRGGEKVEIELRLFAKSDGSWYPINTDTVSFPAQLEVPVEFTWEGAGIEVDLALVVSVFRAG